MAWGNTLVHPFGRYLYLCSGLNLVRISNGHGYETIAKTAVHRCNFLGMGLPEILWKTMKRKIACLVLFYRFQNAILLPPTSRVAKSIMSSLKNNRQNRRKIASPMRMEPRLLAAHERIIPESDTVFESILQKRRKFFRFRLRSRHVIRYHKVRIREVFTV